MKRKGRFLKILAVFLAFSAAALLGLIVWQGVHSRMTIRCVSCERYSALDEQFAEQFYAVCDAIENKAVPGIVYRNEEPADAANYTFTVYTFTMKNEGLVAAETVETRISALNNDILMYQGENECVVQPGKTGQLTVVLFSREGGEESREFTFTYYLWGSKQEVKYKYAK